ncbi:hypothetical protein F5B21DRAFT_1228 [Xylaria acuta]|nr:hypothetical protein F5B21DRAFT_1228 [Xylaria acuta]
MFRWQSRPAAAGGQIGLALAQPASFEVQIRIDEFGCSCNGSHQYPGGSSDASLRSPPSLYVHIIHSDSGYLHVLTVVYSSRQQGKARRTFGHEVFSGCSDPFQLSFVA